MPGWVAWDARYRAKDPEGRKRQLREGHKRWRARYRELGLSKFCRLRQQAAEQAREEGIDKWTVYARWGVDITFLQWAKQCQKSSTSTSKPAAPSI